MASYSGGHDKARRHEVISIERVASARTFTGISALIVIEHDAVEPVISLEPSYDGSDKYIIECATHRRRSTPQLSLRQVDHLEVFA